VTSDSVLPSHQIAARYFEMWNGGDPSIAAEILSPGWIDHAHPEVTGPYGVQEAVEQIRAAQPDLRFHVETTLGDGDLVAVVGTVGRGSRSSPVAPRLIWLIRLEDGQLAEMWTYRDTSQ
jgi:ketosteroid isomerase-like protein